MESFLTLQGEGHWAGHASWFIRLGGCDVGCVWCDVKDSWDAEAHPKFTAAALADEAAAHAARIAVITGGEPAMYDLGPLCNELHRRGFRVHLETSAAHPIRGSFDWITVSPKKFKFPIKEQLHLASELKIVVFNKSDLEWAESWAKEVPATCKKLLQPEWDRMEDVLPLMIGYILEHPEWQMSLQTHKFMNIP